MLLIHHLENSRSHRVLWLLEELSLDYEIKFYKRDPKTDLAMDDLKAIHPLGKSPVITDGKLVLAETAAILQYIVERYGKGKLSAALGSPEQIKQNYWLHAAEGSFMPYLVTDLLTSRIASKSPFITRPIAKAIATEVDKKFTHPNLYRFIKYMEAELSKNTWFAGDEFSIADIQMGYPVEAAFARLELNDDYPNLKDYLFAIRNRPAYQAAIEKGGKLSILAD
ncbi:MAG: glutathione S-transferase [Hyphomicrobiales bacterium]|nr:MAG: glutathione S-transferase [Hyphomicrobiales bacterium]